MAYGEAARALDLLTRLGLTAYMGGKVIDLGCGPEPVLPDAVGVNINPTASISVGGMLSEKVYRNNVDVLCREELRQFRGQFDTVFSSHCLEHLPSPVAWNLRHWAELAKPGGHLVLYLPDERYYHIDPAHPEVPNREHLHYLTMDSFEWHVAQAGGLKVIHLTPDVDVRHGRYSFLAILQR